MARYNKEDIRKFVSYIGPMIRSEATKRGYPICSTTIAQAIIEGACGKSTLAAQYHNHFGLKCGSKWKGDSVNMKTGEYYSGKYTTINDNFRAYASDTDGIAGYYDFISTPRYANLKTATDYIQFATFLKEDGYATSPTYIKTLTDTVKNYGLIQYDHLDQVSDEYFPIYSGATRSIVEALEAIGADSSRKNRQKIYAANFKDKYTFSAVQNMAMLALLMDGKLRRP